jgi:hypothetical protein
MKAEAEAAIETVSTAPTSAHHEIAQFFCNSEADKADIDERTVARLGSRGITGSHIDGLVRICERPIPQAQAQSPHKHQR